MSSSLIERVLAHARAGTTDLAPAERRVAVTRYVDPARLDAERTGIFERAPTIVAHASEIALPGDFVTRERHGTPLLVTRDAAGRARVFVNACRHRGTRLVADAAGHRKNFACPYHAWTYSCDGRLMAVSHASGFPGVDRETMGLVELPSREHLGFLWARLRPGEPLDLEEHLGPMAAELAPLDIGSHVLFEPEERLWKANWKILVEGGLEAYHFRYVHARTIYPMFFDNLLVWDALGSHQRLVLPKRGILELDGKDPATGNLRDQANVLLFLFPNVILMVQKDHLVVFTMTPVSVGETRVTIQMLLPRAPADAREAAHWAKNRAITITALNEDFVMGEEVQAGLGARAFDDVIFGKNEPGPAAFHDGLDAMIREEKGDSR